MLQRVPCSIVAVQANVDGQDIGWSESFLGQPAKETIAEAIRFVAVRQRAAGDALAIRMDGCECTFVGPGPSQDDMAQEVRQRAETIEKLANLVATGAVEPTVTPLYIYAAAEMPAEMPA